MLTRWEGGGGTRWDLRRDGGGMEEVCTVC